MTKFLFVVFAATCSLCTAFQGFPSLKISRGAFDLKTISHNQRTKIDIGTRFNPSRLSLRADPTNSARNDEDAGRTEVNLLDSATVLSDDELEARIRAAGLDRAEPSSEPENLTAIEQAMKQSSKIGKTAIASAASSAISVLNKIEKVTIDKEFSYPNPSCIHCLFWNSTLAAYG